MKNGIRDTLLKKRDGIKPEKKRIKEAAIRKRLFALTDFKKAKSILFYASFRSEVDTIPCIQHAIELKKRIALPRVEREKGKLKLYEIKDIYELVSGYMGILEPNITKNREMSLKDIDVVVIPGAGFDIRGNRLGYGFGYYDRLLKNRSQQLSKSKKHITIIALVFEEQIVPRVPDEIHDVKVDKIITDKRVINCSPPSFPRKRESRLVPAKAGNHKELDSCFHRKPWIPPYQARGRLSQARNDIQTNKNTGGIFR